MMRKLSSIWIFLLFTGMSAIVPAHAQLLAELNYPEGLTT